MRLLNTETFELETFFHDTVPQQYAILSHNWGKEEDEIRFRDVQEGRLKEAHNRPTKLEGSCRIAKGDGYKYIWVDTCCIDNTNSVELQEAINSMFRWYKNSAICYTFLSDIAADDRNPWDTNSKFSSSRWFTRGWTLQELLASPRLRFYNSEWYCLGSKGDLCAIVQKATGIPSPHVLGIKALRDASVAQRMSWAAKRATKRPEDISYSLLGIFGVTMPMIYGEGSKKAFTRLQELIMREIGDDSILAWGFGQSESSSEPLAESTPGRILAGSPADFAKCGHIQAREHANRHSFESGGSLRLHIPLFISAPGNVFGLLKCGDSGRVVGIPLMNVSNDASDEYIRPQSRRPMLLPKPEQETSATPILVRNEHENRTLTASSQKYWFNVQGSVETGLELIDVEPRSCWRKEEALIEAAVTSPGEVKQRTFVRFRHKAGEAHDFLISLELSMKDSQSKVEARCHVMICARNTSLLDVAGNYSRFRPEAKGKQSAGNGMINIQVILEAVQEETMFFLRTIPLTSLPDITCDATVELQILVSSTDITLLQEEELAIKKKVAALSEEAQVRMKAVKEAAEELESVKHELSEMEAKKARLTICLEQERTMVEHANRSQEITMSCLDNLAKRLLSTQLCLESFLDKGIPPTLTGDGDDESEADIRSPILNWAIRNGHLGVVQGLFDTGAATIESKSGVNEETPLHLTALYGHEAIALILLSHGANTESRNKSGWTPLLYAVEYENEQVLRILVEYGADINSKDISGWTPLFHAVFYQLAQMIRILLDLGADVNSGNKFGSNPLHVAVMAANGRGPSFPVVKGATDKEHADIIELLVNKGASMVAINGDGKSPLHCAAYWGNEAILEILLKSGGDVYVNQFTKFGESPLDLAFKQKNVGATNLLLSYGALESSKSGNKGVNAQPYKKSSFPTMAMRGPANDETIVQTDEIVRNRTAVRNPTSAAGQHTRVARKPFELPTNSILDKVLQRRKAI